MYSKTKKPFKKIELTVYILAISSFTLLLYLFVNRNQTSLVVQDDSNKVKDTILAYNNNNLEDPKSKKDLSSIFNDNEDNINSPQIDSTSSANTKTVKTTSSNEISPQAMSVDNAVPIETTVSPETIHQEVNNKEKNEKTIQPSIKEEVVPSKEIKNEKSFSSKKIKVNAHEKKVKHHHTKSSVKTKNHHRYVAYNVKKSETKHHSKKHALGSESKNSLKSGKKINANSYNHEVLSRYEKEPSNHLYKVKSYKVKEGDSIWALAKKFRVSAINLVAVNPQLKNPDHLIVNQVLTIPNR